MSEPDNILLEYMRRFDARQARFEDSLRDASARLALIESYLATMHGDVAAVRRPLCVAVHASL